MMAVEEKCVNSIKTNPSLYNGRPTDSGTMCHSVGTASNTPSIQEDKDGETVESVNLSSCYRNRR